jgi:transposase
MPNESSPGKKPTSRRYSPEEKAAAVRMVRALRAELGTDQGTVARVGRQLGYGVESVRAWVRQADIDDGYTPGVAMQSTRMSEKDKNVSGSVKTADDTIGDAGSARHPHPNATAERLDRQIHSRCQPSRLSKRRKASETMSSYLTLIAFMTFTISPVLVPLIITAVHAIGDVRRKRAPFWPAIITERRTRRRRVEL